MDSNFFLAIAVVTLLAFSLGYLIWFLYRYMKNSNPTANKIQQDLAVMREKVKSYSSTLIPWTSEEWTLLASNMGEHHQKKGLVKEAHGVMHTIYHEPLFTYAYRKYAGGNHTLLLVRTKSNEYVFWKKKDRTEIFKNSEAFGILNKEGKLMSKNGKQIVGEIGQKDQIKALPVMVHEQEVANIASKSKASQARAFDFVKDLAEEDQEKLLVISIPNILKEQIPLK